MAGIIYLFLTSMLEEVLLIDTVIFLWHNIPQPDDRDDGNLQIATKLLLMSASLSDKIICTKIFRTCRKGRINWA